MDDKRYGYTRGAWVEVANVDTDDDDMEIVTAPLKGKAVVEVWDLTSDSETLELLTTSGKLQKKKFGRGLHIAAAEGEILAVKHNVLGKVYKFEWENGGLELSDDDTFNIGKVGDMAYDGDNLLYSRLLKKKVINKKSTGKNKYTVDIGSFGAFVDYLNVD